MTKQLIIVVHGVGVKEAGVSADLLATALDDTPEQNKNLKRTEVNASRLRPHSSDDFHLREMSEYNHDGKRQVFPARIRRYRQVKNQSTEILHERVVADFYWGDISNIASGLPGLLLGLWKTILGLSHIIRENAFSVFPAKGGYDWVMRRLAGFAALTIHGPIAAINIVLLIGVFLNLGIGKILFENPPHAIWATGLVSAALGIYLSKKSPVFLTRFLGGWLTLVALIFLILSWALPDKGIGLGIVGGFNDDAIVNQACGFATDKGLCESQSKGIFLHGMRLITIMSYLFVATIGAAVILSVAELARYIKNPTKMPPSIVSATIALMLLLWIIVIGAIWAVLSNTVPNLIPDKIPLQGILGAIVYCIAGFVALAVGALIAFVRTKVWAAKFNPDDYIDKSNRSVAEKLADTNRMITSGFILWPLRAFLAALAVFVAFATVKLYQLPLTEEQIAAQLIGTNEDTFAGALLLLATIGGLAVAAGQAPLRAGLGIAIDVITWLNDHSWNSAERGQTGHKTVFERVLPKVFSGNPDNKNQGYWRRNRIKQRFDVLATQLIRDERPDRLVIISHSQGTVVAIDVLNSEGGRYRAMMPEGGAISLATMGSPYTHVHNHYFTRAFADIDKMSTIASVAEGGVLTDWLNIFRIDDFVGTHIDPTGKWPREKAVAANGHTYYWVDENVFPELKEFTKLSVT
jgi:hypothetical protein